jgi:hypothetical protein
VPGASKSCLHMTRLGTGYRAAAIPKATSEII